MSSLTRAPTNGQPVFVYGSLLWRSVVQARHVVPAAQPEGLPCLGAPQGGTDVDPHSTDTLPVRGLVLEDLSEHEAAIFDEFEDDEYDKRFIALHILHFDADQDQYRAWATGASSAEDRLLVEKNGIESLKAWVYVWTDNGQIDDVLWKPARDFKPYENSYLRMCGEFVRSEIPQELRTASLARGGGLDELCLSGGRANLTSTVEDAMSLLRGSDSQAPTNNLCLAASGDAISVAVEVAQHLETSGVARISRIATSGVADDDADIGSAEGRLKRRSRAQLYVYMARDR